MDFLITRQELFVLIRKIGCMSERRDNSERNRREEQPYKFVFWYVHFVVVVELRLLMKRQRRTRPRGAGATQQRRARKEQTRARTLRTGYAALAQRNRRSVSENASLQDRFRERASKGWSNIKFERRRLRFSRKN